QQGRGSRSQVAQVQVAFAGGNARGQIGRQALEDERIAIGRKDQPVAAGGETRVGGAAVSVGAVDAGQSQTVGRGVVDVDVKMADVQRRKAGGGCEGDVAAIRADDRA